MLHAEEKEDILPKCPRGTKELTRIWFRAPEGLFGKLYVYFCPECRKVLGISHRIVHEPDCYRPAMVSR